MALPIGHRNGVPIPIGERSGIGRMTPRHGIPFYSPAEIYTPHDYIFAAEETTIDFTTYATIGGELNKVDRAGNALLQFYLISTLAGPISVVFPPESMRMRGTTTIIFNQYGKPQGYQRMAGIIWFVFDCELKIGKLKGETQITFDNIGLAHNVLLKGETTITFTEQATRTATAEMIGLDSDITFINEGTLQAQSAENIAAETTIIFSENATIKGIAGCIGQTTITFTQNAVLYNATQQTALIGEINLTFSLTGTGKAKGVLRSSVSTPSDITFSQSAVPRPTRLCRFGGGTGYAAYETVQCSVVWLVPLTSLDAWSVQTDGSGNFTTDRVIPEYSGSCVAFLIGGTGQTSHTAGQITIPKQGHISAATGTSGCWIYSLV